MNTVTVVSPPPKTVTVLHRDLRHVVVSQFVEIPLTNPEIIALVDIIDGDVKAYKTDTKLNNVELKEPFDVLQAKLTAITELILKK
jgi:hypothetical protein